MAAECCTSKNANNRLPVSQDRGAGCVHSDAMSGGCWCLSVGERSFTLLAEIFLFGVLGNGNWFHRFGRLYRLPNKVRGVGIERGLVGMSLSLLHELQALRTDF